MLLLVSKLPSEKETITFIWHENIYLIFFFLMFFVGSICTMGLFSSSFTQPNSNQSLYIVTMLGRFNKYDAIFIVCNPFFHCKLILFSIFNGKVPFMTCSGLQIEFLCSFFLMTNNAGTSKVSFGVNHGINPINKMKSYLTLLRVSQPFDHNSEVVKWN